MDMTAVKDVTKFYTNDNQNEVNKRRGEEAHDIQSAIEHESSRLMEQSRKISGNWVSLRRGFQNNRIILLDIRIMTKNKIKILFLLFTNKYLK